MKFPYLVLKFIVWSHSYTHTHTHIHTHTRASLVAQMVKNPPAMQETQVWFLDQEDPLEKGMATYFSILAQRIPWTEEPGRLQSMGSQRVGNDLCVYMYACICVCVCVCLILTRLSNIYFPLDLRNKNF